MKRPVTCRRSIPTFALTLSLILPTAAVADAAAPRETAPDGRAAVVFESLLRWLGLAPASPAAPRPIAAAAIPGSGAPPSGGETSGGHDPNGGGDPPPGYEPDLNPGGG